MIYNSIVFLIFGLVFGSFYNVVIYRLPNHQSLSTEPSHCPSCAHRLGVFDLVPVLSFILLKGRCRYCQEKISFRYPLIELITGLMFVLTYLRYGFSSATWIGLLLHSILIIVAMIDIDTMEIMDRFHIMILILAIVVVINSPLSLYSHVIGFFLISTPFFLIATFIGGMGGGDIKLIAVAGLLLGIKATFIAFFISSISGGIVAAYLLLTKQKERKSLIAFGPYLCIGISIAYLYGIPLFDAYINLFR